MLVLLLSSLLFHSTSSSHLMKLSMDQNNAFNKVWISFGCPSLSLLMSIDISTNVTWIRPNPIAEVSSSMTIKEGITLIDQMNNLLNGKELLSSLSLVESSGKETTVNGYQFYYFKSIPSSYESLGGLAMGSSFTDTHYSLIHLLNRNGDIPCLQFSLVNELRDRYLYFGGIPSESIENRSPTYCNVIGREGHWDCLLSEVSIHNESEAFVYAMNSSDDTSYAQFELRKGIIFAPKSFMEQLYSTYYKEGLKSGLCKLTKENSIHSMSCFFNYRYQSGSISFHLGDFVYELQLMDLWKCSDDSCNLSFAENLEGNYWVLGLEFFKNMQVLFDYEAKQLRFYSKKSVNGVNDGKTRKLFMCLIVLLALGVGLLISFRLKAKP